MNDDDKLIMELATPASVEHALQLLEHPFLKAAKLCETRSRLDHARAEFWRRLAGSIRKAYQIEVDTGHA